MSIKKFNPWDKANQKQEQKFPRQRFGSGKFGDARVGNRRPGARGK
jgi:hypothetical protein